MPYQVHGRKLSVFFSFGKSGLMIYLGFLKALPPISINLLLPALPEMADYFQADYGSVALTVSLFMLFYALSLLIGGAFSDSYGRKPIIFGGLILYLAAAVMSAAADTVAALVLGRCLQALGCGAVSAAGLAVVKDIFQRQVRTKALTYIQIVTIAAALVAPVMGGWLLTISSWRGTFAFLGLLAALALAGCLGFRETKVNTPGLTISGSIVRSLLIWGNKDFRSALIVFSAVNMILMAFVASSSQIYTGSFSVTPRTYSYFLAANAALSLPGPLLYLKFFYKLPRHFYLSGCFMVMTFFGAVLIIYGSLGPYVFACIFWVISLAGSASRPLSMNILLSQSNTGSGAAAGLVSCVPLLFGALAMLVCSLPWSSLITA